MTQAMAMWDGGVFIVVASGEPQAQPRARHHQKRTYTDYTPAQKAWRVALRDAAIQGAHEAVLPPGPLHIRHEMRFPIAASHSAKKRLAMDGQPHTFKPDGDNLEKMLLDAIHPAANNDKFTSVLDKDERIAGRFACIKLWTAGTPGMYFAIAPWHIPLPSFQETFGDTWDRVAPQLFHC